MSYTQLASHQAASAKTGEVVLYIHMVGDACEDACCHVLYKLEATEQCDTGEQRVTVVQPWCNTSVDDTSQRSTVKESPKLADVSKLR